jgi:NAD(P)-dependent dehydrogenase (short-subunit alcohol dehydrogenase family)
MAPVQGVRRVFVTGGGRGLGAAIVKALAAAGHHVTFTYRSSGDAAEASAKALTIAYPEQHFTALQVDLADRDAVAAFTTALGTTTRPTTASCTTPATPTTPWR